MDDTALEQLRQQLPDYACEIAISLLGDPNRRASSKRTLRFGKHGSLALVVGGDKAGYWFDHENGEGGDLLDLIRREMGLDFLGALAFAGQYTGGSDPTHRPKARRAVKMVIDDTDLWKRERALATWNEATDIGGTLAQLYLGRRGIVLPESVAGRVLRFHPRCAPFGHDPHPAMVTLLRDIETDEPRAIQKTALSPDGGKLERRTFGPKSRAAVKLSDHTDVETALTIGEGTETVLSGMTLGYVPAWAIGDAGELAQFPVLSGIEGLTILIDHDQPDRRGRQAGINAAARCAQRWTRAGRDVRCVIPKVLGRDLNDVCKEGKSNDKRCREGEGADH